MQKSSLVRLAQTLGLAGAMALGASAAIAQEYDYGPNEQVIITAPPYHGRSSTTGAPIRDVAMQREVRFDDLDLRSNWGARALKQRIKYQARALCQRLDNMYPVSASDSPPCYETALRDAMGQADEAIAQARGYDD